MPTSLRLFVAGVVAAATLLLVCVVALAPGRGALERPDHLFLWIALTAMASAYPVRLPRGSLVSVSLAPILAVAALGGPAAAALVGAVGTTELRELRGRVPWYGTLFNHAAITIPAVAAAGLYQLLAPPVVVADVRSFAALMLAAVLYFLSNGVLIAVAVGLRDRKPVLGILRGDLWTLTKSLFGLAPLAWIMAVVWTVQPVAVLLFALPLYTTRGAYQSVVELRDMFTQTVRSLASAVDAKDKFTSGHSERVQRIAVDIGRQMRCSESELEALEWGGLLHDIGKIGVPDAVLLKQDRLNKEERTIMNQHPVKGEEIIKPVQKLAPELPIIRHHHEWYNGSGYPDHLVGEQIPKLARILHVADAFEAMTAARPYRMSPLTPAQAMAEIRRYTGIQFDPVAVDAFSKTHWVAGVEDHGRATEERVVPMLTQVAANRTAGQARRGPGLGTKAN